MFSLNISVKRFLVILLSVFFLELTWGYFEQSNVQAETLSTNTSDWDTIEQETLNTAPDELIRFHVLANSDSEEDQALKRAVRDAILTEVSPLLAKSESLAESSQILQTLRPQMEEIAKKVVKEWGKDYEIRTEFGYFDFPTKSYGSLVLPSGKYEALRILIGKAEGSNWWCVLFPPLCFVDIEHSTAVQVDGKPGIPIDNTVTAKTSVDSSQKYKGTQRKQPKIWVWEKVKEILGG